MGRWRASGCTPRASLSRETPHITCEGGARWGGVRRAPCLHPAVLHVALCLLTCGCGPRASAFNQREGGGTCARSLNLSASTGRGVRKATRGRLGPWDEVPVSSSTVSARCTPRWLGGTGAAEPRAVHGGGTGTGCAGSLILSASTGRGAQKPRRPGPLGRGVRGFHGDRGLPAVRP